MTERDVVAYRPYLQIRGGGKGGRVTRLERVDAQSIEGGGGYKVYEEVVSSQKCPSYS